MRRPIAFVVTLIACILSTGALRAQFGPANVIVNEVIERPVAPVQTFVATVMPLRKSVVGSAVEGRVEQFLYDADNPETKLTYVTKGQPLANLREGTIEIKVDAARAQRDLRKAEWEEADETQIGRVAEAEAKLKSATENWQFTKNQFDRSRRLYEDNRSISLEEYEQARSNMYTSEQEYIQAKIADIYVKRRDRIKQAKARLDESEALLNEWLDRQEKYTIRAPFDGFVIAEHTEIGAWITSGDPVAEVVQLHPVEVRAFVPEKHIGQLQIGGAAIIRPNVPSLKSGDIPLGEITGIIAQAVTRSRTFPVKIQVDNPKHVLKAGMLAEVELEVGASEPAMLVPKDALVLGGPTPRIFLAVADAKDPKQYVAKMLPVEPGASLGKWIAVEAIGDEIVAGDLVIEKGNERLRPGSPLMINRDGATVVPK